VLPLERTRRGAVKIVSSLDLDPGTAVDGMSESIEHPSYQSGTHGHARGVPAGHHAVPQLNATGFFQGHRQHAAVAEADYLAAHRASAGDGDFAKVADGCRGARGFDQQAGHLYHFAHVQHGFEIVESRQKWS
jgi:hypothetical protein